MADITTDVLIIGTGPAGCAGAVPVAGFASDAAPFATVTAPVLRAFFAPPSRDAVW